ncbi:MAG: nucleotidyl transferase AbiEii/AbiGii toxin family protein [Anaerolineaceae bacterium]|nr:nucleotidyl transferase AbiEii/AbiGii toxin family protein [Anaerolineaceae bacterium]
MANVPQMIRRTAQRKQVQQYIVEKDYAISYLMAVIATTEGLGDSLVMKGGTALKKLYFEDYRFSEDLDYSTRELGPLSDTVIENCMDVVVQRMHSKLNVRGPFQVIWEPLVLRVTHPGGQKAYIVRVQFPGQRQLLCRLKVEITVDEPILAPIVYCSIHHDYPEEFPEKVPAYSIQEITAEKLRTLLQVKVRLQTRGWGASRICRDYYDLWHLLREEEVKNANILPLLREKCAVRDVSFESPQDFMTDNLREVAIAEWNQQLLPFVPNAPKAKDILSDMEKLLRDLSW